jgi:enoyl-[acyl-carrier protein] reductase / trans-2-enoyl-CoA reductase (NAD+)
MLIKPMVRGSICLNAHPLGCALETERQIEYVRERALAYSALRGPKAVLVIGCSTGYGLATRIAAAFGFRAATMGVSFEKESSASSTGTPGWYNNRAFDEAATAGGLRSATMNIDAFSVESKGRVVAAAREQGVKFDLVVYSLASPVRVDPATGEMHRSAIKPIGAPYRGKTVDPFTRELSEAEVQSATEAEVTATVKVMGGEDWELWMDALRQGGVLSQDSIAVAYSYIGPSLSWPIYRDGTIGAAKADLERAAGRMRDAGQRAYVSINKALVTRSSAVIPVIPLYISTLFKVMKERGVHEDCVAQADRLLRERLYTGRPLPLDEEGRIRLDELEMSRAVQDEVESRMRRVDSQSLSELADVEGFRLDFLRVHGFEVEGVDYEAEVTPQGQSLASGGSGSGRTKDRGGRPAAGADAERAVL